MSNIDIEIPEWVFLTHESVVYLLKHLKCGGYNAYDRRQRFGWQCLRCGTSIPETIRVQYSLLVG